MEIYIDTNFAEMQSDVHEFAKTQLPFATSNAINSTIFDVRRRVVGSTWRNAFTMRNKRFPNILWRVKKSNKRDLGAVLYQQHMNYGQNDYVDRHVSGGVKRPRSGQNLAIPGRQGPGRTATGRIPKGKRPRAIMTKKSSFIRQGPGNTKYIIERRKGETFVRYVLKPSAQIKRSFLLSEDATDTVERVFGNHFWHQWARAIKTSKYLK